MTRIINFITYCTVLLVVFSCNNNLNVPKVSTPDNLLQKYSLENYEFSKEKVDSLEQKLSAKVLHDTLNEEAISLINELLVQYKNSNPNKAWSLKSYVETLYKNHPNSNELAYTFQLLGHIHQEIGLYREALGYYFTSHDLCARNNNFIYKDLISLNIGDIYFNQEIYDIALSHYMDSYSELKEWKYNQGLAYATAKIAMTYIKLEKLYKAKVYLKKSKKYITKKQLSFPKLHYVKSLQAALLLKTKNKEKANTLIKELSKSTNNNNSAEVGNLYKLLGEISIEDNDTLVGSEYYQKSYGIFTKLHYPKKQVQMHLKTVEHSPVFRNNPRLALEELKKAMYLAKKHHFLEELLEGHKLLMNVAEKQGIDSLKTTAFNLYSGYKKQLEKSKIPQLEAKLEEVKHKEVKQVEIQLEESGIQLTNEKKIKQNYIIIVILSVFFIAWLLYKYFYTKKTSRIILSQERKNNTLKNKHLQQTIEHKEKELTSKVMQLAQEKEILKQIVKEIKEEGQTVLANKIKNKTQPSNHWKEFEEQFVRVHPTFYEALKERSKKNLTKREIQICAFLKLNMSSKDIANLTNLTLSYIEVSRSSIRKKLALDKKDNLIKFLQEIN